MSPFLDPKYLSGLPIILSGLVTVQLISRTFLVSSYWVIVPFAFSDAEKPPCMQATSPFDLTVTLAQTLLNPGLLAGEILRKDDHQRGHDGCPDG